MFFPAADRLAWPGSVVKLLEVFAECDYARRDRDAKHIDEPRNVSGIERRYFENLLAWLIFLAMNFSSFAISAANLRMPSAVFSVAIASSFRR